MSEIKILHMSDIHFFKTEGDQDITFRQEVQTRLIDAVESYSGEKDFPDFVVVTGDIAYSGKKHQYDEALEFLNKLKAILPANTPFLAVPGNHDVDRDAVDPFTSLYDVVNRELVDKFLEQPGQVQRKVNIKFKAYRDFIERLNSTLYESGEDYFWVKNIKEKNVSFLGLNSAWASEGDNDRFNIALGYPQMVRALERSKGMTNRILLMHHPPVNWLTDMESDKFRAELFKHCRLMLHGHVHADNSLVFKDAVDDCICLGANASYTNDQGGFIGFQFIDADFSVENTSVKVWPYILHERRKDFIPHSKRWPGQEGKPYFVLEHRTGFELPGFPPTIQLKRQKLPVGLQTFSELINGKYLYVDKTKYIYSFFKNGGKYYFLSRPRRFGKTLLLSTLKEIFSGNKELFKGLWIYDKIQWEEFPVIHIDFLGLKYGNKKELTDSIDFIIERNAKRYGVKLHEKGYDKKFYELIEELSKKNKVVILIDEYDKPIIEHIENQAAAKVNRGILKTFYEAVKGADRYLKFVFITGVSKFSKMSIFSALNNLNDITLTDEFAALLGYTEEEMKIYFHREIINLARKLKREKEDLVHQLRNWYNGYSWDGKSFVYNPLSILKLFQEGKFDNYWFSTATPTFLIEFIRQSGRDIREYEGYKTSGYLFEQYDIDNIDVISLLFQTGYLTVKEREIIPFSKPEYILDYPNNEVRESFAIYLLESFTHKEFIEVEKVYGQLKDAVNKD